MSGRVNPFADLNEAPVFAVKPKPMAVVAREGIDKIADENGFQPSGGEDAERRQAKEAHLYDGTQSPDQC